MSAHILLDLDGTLLDVEPRYQRLHQELVTRFGGRALPPGEYWQAKRSKVPERHILEICGVPTAQVERALRERANDLETWQYLAIDRLWPWTLSALTELESMGSLWLVTLRRNREMLEKQLVTLGLRARLQRVLCGAGDGSTDAKARLLEVAAGAPSGPSVLIGDTEVDIASGRALGCRTVAVRCGLRNDAALAPSAPDHVLDCLKQVPELLRAHGW